MLHLVSNGLFAYGYFTTELYFLDSPLDWGYVEHPPLSVWILRFISDALGSSVFAIRLLPAAAGSLTIGLVALIARELGGGRVAQFTAGVCFLIAPINIAMCSFYSMNCFEQAFGALGFLVYLKIINHGRPRDWLLLAVVLGLALLNKLTMIWIGLALMAALLITPQRRWLLTRWPWVAGLIALALVSPYLIWQWHHHWPMLDIGQSIVESGSRVAPWKVLGQLAMAFHPVTVPLWLAGGIYCLFGKEMKTYRSVGWIWILVIVVLTAIGTVRYYYLIPANIIALVCGCVLFEKRFGTAKRRWVVLICIGVLFIAGVISAPMATPLMTPERYIAFQNTLKIKPSNPSQQKTGDLPFHFALRFHGPVISSAIRDGYRQLSAIERSETAILASDHDEAAAINVLSPPGELPRAISPHNSYWIWGPGSDSPKHLLVLARSSHPVLNHCRAVRPLTSINCPFCLSYLSTKSVYFCQDLEQSLNRLWPKLKDLSNKAVQRD